MSVNPSGEYHPVTKVVWIDGVPQSIVCTCDEGGYPWDPDFLLCPVHGEEHIQQTLAAVEIEARRV